MNDPPVVEVAQGGDHVVEDLEDLGLVETAT